MQGVGAAACLACKAHLAAGAQLRRPSPADGSRAWGPQAAGLGCSSGLLAAPDSPPGLPGAAAGAAAASCRTARCLLASQRPNCDLVEQLLHLVLAQRAVKEGQLRQRALVAAAGVAVRPAAEVQTLVEAEGPAAVTVGLGGQAGVDVQAVSLPPLQAGGAAGVRRRF
jgi:hypothetical protein